VSSLSAPPCRLEPAHTEAPSDIRSPREGVSLTEPDQPKGVVGRELHGLRPLHRLLEEGNGLGVAAGLRVTGFLPNVGVTLLASAAVLVAFLAVVAVADGGDLRAVTRRVIRL